MKKTIAILEKMFKTNPEALEELDDLASSELSAALKEMKILPEIDNRYFIVEVTRIVDNVFVELKLSGCEDKEALKKLKRSHDEEKRETSV